MSRLFQEPTEIDLAALDEAEARAALHRPREAGRGVYLLCVLLGLVWLMGISLGAYALFGQARLLAFTPLEGAALGAAAFMPALMMWIAGTTAREGMRARVEAGRLADAAEQLLSPAPGAEAAARRLAVAVRGEIAALDRALETTLARLKEVDGAIARQSAAVADMSIDAHDGANAMISGMERERAELLRIAQDLNAQANMIGDVISSQSAAVQHAARTAESEIRAADEALDSRLTSFSAAAALINDRTRALHGAAQASAESALRLENALSTALDVLAKATHLTDAARDSATKAATAANSTAQTARDRAAEDARRAADALRGEAAAAEREASDALDRLRSSSSASASGVDAANMRPRTAPQSFLRGPAEVQRGRMDSQPEPRREESRREPELRREEPRREEPRREPEPRAGGWTWRDLMSSVDEEDTRRPAPRRPDADRAPELASEPKPDRAEARREPPTRLEDGIVGIPHPLPAAHAVERAGVRLSDVFSRGALDRIGQRARTGTQARRRAVRDAAPEAVNAVADYLDRDAQARQEAAAFLRADGARIAETLARGRASMSADATRLFLLLDAASA